jgi:hypothetical protein|tara:strand:- start:1736 stop:1915 length:180 start_codon:yes stop_codon:yes gene_type:complete
MGIRTKHYNMDKPTQKEVAENAIITLGIALKAIQHSGSHLRIIQDIKNQIVELRKAFKI